MYTSASHYVGLIESGIQRRSRLCLDLRLKADLVEYLKNAMGSRVDQNGVIVDNRINSSVRAVF